MSAQRLFCSVLKIMVRKQREDSSQLRPAIIQTRLKNIEIYSFAIFLCFSNVKNTSSIQLFSNVARIAQTRTFHVAQECAAHPHPQRVRVLCWSLICGTIRFCQDRRNVSAQYSWVAPARQQTRQNEQNFLYTRWTNWQEVTSLFGISYNFL